MPQLVELPDSQSVEFPDGATPAQMTAALRKHFPQHFKTTEATAAGTAAPLPASSYQWQRAGAPVVGQPTVPAEESRLTQLPGVLAQEGMEVTRGAANVFTAGARTVDALGNRINSALGWDQGTALSRGAAVTDRALASVAPVAEEDQTFGTDLAQGVGNLGAMLAGGAAARAAGAGPKMAAAVGAGMGFGAEFDDAMKSSIARGDDPDLAFKKALAYGTAAMGIEYAGGAGRVLRKWFGTLKPEQVAGRLTAWGVSKEVANAAAAGFAEEASQRLAQNLIVNEGAQPFEGVVREGAVGALLQGAAEGPSAGRVRSGNAVTSVTTVTAAPTADDYPAGDIRSQAGMVLPVQPEPAPPTAVFRGPNGENIEVELGGAPLEQAQAAIFRQHPGSEFVGLGGAAAPSVGSTPSPETTIANEANSTPATAELRTGGESNAQEIQRQRQTLLTAEQTDAGLRQPLAGFGVTPIDQFRAGAARRTLSAPEESGGAPNKVSTAPSAPVETPAAPAPIAPQKRLSDKQKRQLRTLGWGPEDWNAIERGEVSVADVVNRKLVSFEQSGGGPDHAAAIAEARIQGVIDAERVLAQETQPDPASTPSAETPMPGRPSPATQSPAVNVRKGTEMPAEAAATPDAKTTQRRKGSLKAELPTATAPAPEITKPEQAALRKEVVKAADPEQQQKSSFDPKAAKAQKKFLLDEIDKAIAEAPEQRAPVPADADKAELETLRSWKAGDTEETFKARREEAVTRIARKHGVTWDKAQAQGIVPAVDYMFDRLAGKPATKKSEGSYGVVDRVIGEQAEKIVIEVPGDGTFSIVNSRQALKDFKERAAKFPTTAPRAPRHGPTAPRTEPSSAGPLGKLTSENATAAAELFRSTDETRKSIQHLWSDGKQTVGTDGRRLIIIEKGIGGTEKQPVMVKDGKATKVKPNASREADGYYPDWRQPVPNEETYFTVAELDAQRFFTLVRQAQEATSEKNPSVMLWRNPDGSLGVTAESDGVGSYNGNRQDGALVVGAFNPEYLLDFARAARKLGAEKLELRADEREAALAPLVVKAKGMKGVLMPMRIMGDSYGAEVVTRKAVEKPVPPAEDVSAAAVEPTAEQVAEEADKLTTPEATAAAVLNAEASPAQQTAAEQAVKPAQARLTARKNLKNRKTERGAIINPAQLVADLLVAGAHLLKRGGQWAMSKGQWVSDMVRAYGQDISRWLDATWIRLARIQNQQANGVGPVGQGHLNQIEAAAGKTNIAEEQKPLYDPATLAQGKPGLLTRLAPTSTQIRILGGDALARARRLRDVTEATQAAAVKKQSDNLWQQLVAGAREANPLSRWRLPNWIVATPRARAFKARVLHIAARLNATGRDAQGNFTFGDFTMRAGSMSLSTASKSQLTVGDQFQTTDPVTGVTEMLTLGPIITTPEGRVFHQLLRPVDAATQAELYQHFAREYPELIWFMDMFIDPALAGVRQKINGIEVPVFNRFAASAMMADADPNFTALTAYTPDVLVTRSLLGSIRGALSFRAGTRSSGRKYKSGTSREGGHVRDLLSGFNVRTWQMLAEKSRKEWRQAVLASAVPIRGNTVPAGFVKLETGMDDLWQAVKRLRNWQSPVDPATGNPLYPETQGRMADDGTKEWKAFFGEAAQLRGRQLMLPEALVQQLVRRYTAHVEHGTLYRLGAWAVRNSARLYLAMPTTYVANVLTNDLFTLEAATRRILSGVAGRNAQDLRFARELMAGEFWKWFPGLRGMVDGTFRNTVREVLPDNIFADQTALADVKVRMDEDPMSYLRSGEIGAAALQAIRYGDIDVKSKQRMAYAWLKATAVTNAKRAGLRGAALRRSVDAYMANPPMADRARAVEIAGFELLNYADTPDWLQTLASNDFGKLLLPFPRFGYHYLAKNAQRAAAVKDFLSRVPKRSRPEALADFLTFLLWPAGGLGVVLAKALGGGDDDEARKLVGTSFKVEQDRDGNLVQKPLPRDLITVNRLNLSAWARGLGLGTDREDDFWLRVRNYPVLAMAGAAILAENDARKFGPKEGAKSYLSAVGDLASDFFSLGAAARVPAKFYQEFMGKKGDRMAFDPYGSGVPLVAYVTDQTLDSLVPGSRQADLVIRWLDPVQRQRNATKDFQPGAWDAARVGHVTGLLDRMFTGAPGRYGSLESTLPPELRRGQREPQVSSEFQRAMEMGGFNVRAVPRRAYERALE